MSDDDDYEYGAYYDSEDDYREDIADHVNSLAEHTCYSPVLVNAHPDFDIDYDEWEYLTDEYWDGENDATLKTKAAEVSETQSSGKRKRSHQDTPEGNTKHKRRKMTTSEHTFRHQTVVWKGKDEDSELRIPTLQSGEGEKITVLENWRELLDRPAKEEGIAPVNADENKAKMHGKPKHSEKQQSSRKKRVANTIKEAKTGKKKNISTRPTRASTRLEK